MTTPKQKTLSDLFVTALPREREKAGLTQAALAQRCNLSVGYVAALEAGRRSPTFATVSLIAKALGIPDARLVQ